MLCTLNLPHSLKVEATQNVSSLQKLLVHGFVDFPNTPLLYKPSTILYCPGQVPTPQFCVSV